MAPSLHMGMGAIPYEAGTAFRVWAPFAENVSVAGEFNGWSEAAQPLTSEGNGYWSADVPGAIVGQQYKYVMVNDSTKFWKNDPYAREIREEQGLRGIMNSLIHPPDYPWGVERFALPPWNELIIYELHIGTFNDEPTPGPGKFGGVIQKLPYLRDLGINAIEVMAAGEFTTDLSWGYNPAYIFAIEQSYGGLTGLKDLVDAAHLHGIAVIFDVVYNHFGPEGLDQSVWRFDGWSQGTYGGIYFYNDDRASTPWGVANRPDYGRGEVRQYLRDNALTWLEARHMDGLRWDATNYIRNIGYGGDQATGIPDGWNLMQWINNEIDARHPGGDKISIAEDMQNNEWVTKDSGAGGAGFDAQWDADFVHVVRASVIGAADDARDMYAVAAAIYHRFNLDAFERVIYIDSHDEDANGRSRVPEEIWPGNAGSWWSRKRSTLGAGIVSTAPGIPLFFQGQEFVEDGYFRDDRPLDWSKAATYSGIVNLYSDLIKLRRNWYDNTRGLRGQQVNVHHVNNSDKVIAYHRWDTGGPGDDVIVVLNMSSRGYDSYTVGFPREGLWKVRLNSDWDGYSPDFGNYFSYDTTAQTGAKDGMPSSGNVGVGPYTIVVLSQDG
jgi:1,4-alpha-glucan branching enzyme